MTIASTSAQRRGPAQSYMLISLLYVRDGNLGTLQWELELWAHMERYTQIGKINRAFNQSNKLLVQRKDYLGPSHTI